MLIVFPFHIPLALLRSFLFQPSRRREKEAAMTCFLTRPRPSMISAWRFPRKYFSETKNKSAAMPIRLCFVISRVAELKVCLCSWEASSAKLPLIIDFLPPPTESLSTVNDTRRQNMSQFQFRLHSRERKHPILSVYSHKFNYLVILLRNYTIRTSLLTISCFFVRAAHWADDEASELHQNNK